MLNARMDLTGPNGVHFSYATSPVKFHWGTAQNIKMCQDEPSVTKKKKNQRVRNSSLSIYLLVQVPPMQSVLDQNYRYMTWLKNNQLIILMVN